MRVKCILFLAGVVLVALVVGGCATPEDRLRQEVMLQIKRLDSNANATVFAIERLGAGAVPYVADALLDPATTPRVRQELIYVLGGLQDHRAIPALVKVADECTVAEVTDDILKDPECPQKLSLLAQRTIARLLDPKAKRPGSFRSAFPDPYNPSTLAAQRIYYTDIIQWYREWRSGYDERKFVCNP
jgi:hypothetical protein